jgi:hypothetical protein
VEKTRKTQGKLRKPQGKHVENTRKTQGKNKENARKIQGKRKENMWKTQGKPIRNFPHPQGRVIPPFGHSPFGHSGETKTEFKNHIPKESRSSQGGDPQGEFA